MKSKLVYRLLKAQSCGPPVRGASMLQNGQFCQMVHGEQFRPGAVSDLLVFLQHCLDAGSSLSTLKVYFTAIAAFHPLINSCLWASILWWWDFCKVRDGWTPLGVKGSLSPSVRAFAVDQTKDVENSITTYLCLVNVYVPLACALDLTTSTSHSNQKCAMCLNRSQHHLERRIYPCLLSL